MEYLLTIMVFELFFAIIIISNIIKCYCIRANISLARRLFFLYEQSINDLLITCPAISKFNFKPCEV